MSDAAFRQMTMLSLIPRHPRRVDAGQLHRELLNRGYDITLRSVQRDLLRLSGLLPLVGDEAKPQGWSWQADAELLTLPGLDPQAALTFKLVEEYLGALLPATTLTYLRPWFRSATNVLEDHGNGLAKWPQKLRVVPRGQILMSPKIDSIIQATVYQALLEEKRLAVGYLPRGAKEERDYEINPLSLVVRDPVIYLIGTAWDYDNPLHFVLHRIVRADISDVPARRPVGFDLDAHIRNGELGWPQGGSIRLVADFERMAAVHLFETPLSEDQRISEIDEDTLRVEATVVETMELRAWLRGFGEEVRVLKPKAFAKSLA